MMRRIRTVDRSARNQVSTTIYLKKDHSGSLAEVIEEDKMISKAKTRKEFEIDNNSVLSKNLSAAHKSKQHFSTS